MTLTLGTVHIDALRRRRAALMITVSIGPTKPTVPELVADGYTIDAALDKANNWSEALACFEYGLLVDELEALNIILESVAA